jgi:carbon-monoxide dehydrogenase large subunit
MTEKLVGQPMKRLEDPALLRGCGRYVDDFHMPGMLHAAFVRSDEAHAKIRGIDTRAAKQHPGVHAVLTLADLPKRFHDMRMHGMPNPHIKQNIMPYVLAKDEVCHVGEPIAIVIADDRYIAEDAAALVAVDYQPLPAAGDAKQASKKGAPLAHAGAPDNIGAQLHFGYGDIDAAFRTAKHVVKEELFMHRGLGHSIEGRAILAAYDPFTDHMTIYTASQGPHAAKRAIVGMLGWDDERVRVVAPDVGGGFGPKMSFYAEQIGIAIASVELKRPIKWIEDRREHFNAATQERDQYWDCEMALDEDGKILGLRIHMIHDKGAFMPHGTILPHISCTTVPGPYVIPAYKIDCDVVLTNKPPVAPVRGAGRPQAVFAMERMMDAAAARLKMDRAEIRRRNTISAEQMPYAVGLTFRDGKPLTYDSGNYPECLEKVLKLADYDGFAKRQAAALKEGRYIGIGMASVVEGTGLGPFEGATVRIGPSGTVTLITGAAAQGQGHVTTFAQICAEKFGIQPGDVRVITADTGAIANGTGTFASRQAVNAGSSTHLASEIVREKVLLIASHILEAAVGDLELAGGNVTVKGTDKKISFRDISRAVTGQSGFALPAGIEPGLEATRYFSPEQAAYANGTHVAEVEVDIETGGVKVTGYWISHDCGVVINPLVVEGQVQGGLAHGIGNALLEWMHYDPETCQPLTTTLADYLLPTADQVPTAKVTHVVSPSPLNPLGVKGAGEGGTIPVPAAIVSAIEHALSPFRVHLTQAPVPPHHLVALINKGGAHA